MIISKLAQILLDYLLFNPEIASALITSSIAFFGITYATSQYLMQKKIDTKLQLWEEVRTKVVKFDTALVNLNNLLSGAKYWPGGIEQKVEISTISKFSEAWSKLKGSFLLIGERMGMD